MNLAVNARDAMPQGGKLTIETSERGAGRQLTPRRTRRCGRGRYVLLAVSDTGCGMDDGRRRRASLSRSSPPRSGKGTGLGLATVYGIVKQSGGHIEVYSEPGVGTTFKIYLPPFRAPAAALSESRAGKRRHGRETILLVEDEETFENLRPAILRGVGYTVLEAAGGEAAIELMAAHGESITCW